MSRLTRYLVRTYLVRLAVVLLAVAGFALVFDLLDIGPRVIRRSGWSGWALPRYALIRLPTLVTELMPVVVLVAGLLTASDLLRWRELVVMWGAGVSRLGLVARLWPAVLLVVGGKLLIDDWGVPATIPILRTLGVADLKTVGLPTGSAIWVRVGSDVLRLPADAAVARRPRDLLILRLDADGRLLEQIEAASAEPGPDGWLLREVSRRAAGSSPPERLAEWTWPARVRLEEVALMARSPRELSVRELVRVIAADGYGVGGIEAHRTWLHARIAGLVGLAALVVLPLALVRRIARVGATLALFVKGLAIGFLYVIGNGFLLALGELGLVAPALAAWAAPLVLGAAALLLAGLLEHRQGRRVPPLAPPAPA